MLEDRQSVRKNYKERKKMGEDRDRERAKENESGREKKVSEIKERARAKKTEGEKK